MTFQSVEWSLILSIFILLKSLIKKKKDIVNKITLTKD